MSAEAKTAGSASSATPPALLEPLVAASPVAIVALDINRRITTWNPAAETLFGWRAAEVIGGLLPTFPPDSPFKLDEHFVELASGGALTNVETVRQRKDGSLVDVLLSTAPLKSANGEVIGVVALVLDITDRRTAERERERLLAELCFERNRLATLFRQAPAFIVVMRGPQHVFELANDAYRQLVGFRDLIGRPAAQALPELADQGLAERLDAVLETGESFTANEMRLMLQREPNGPLEERFASFVYQAIEEADGTRSGIIAHGMDVTEQVRANALLLESEKRFRTVVELSPDGIVVHRNGVVVFANGAAARMAGTPRPEHLIGRAARDFVQADSRAVTEARLEAMAAGRAAPASVQQWLRLDGTAAYVEVSSLPITFDGEPAIQTVFRDITERRHLEQQLRESQKLESIGRLAGGIAHDFNNILTAIRGYSGMSRMALPSTHPVQADLVEIEQSVDRAAALTRQLLAFGRRQMLRSESVDVRAVFGDMESMLRRLLGAHVDLVTRVDGAMQAITGDRAQIEQVIVNLVVNARDAMPDGGTIMLKATQCTMGDDFAEQHEGAVAGRYACIAVEDNGHGMTPEVLAQVFEPFFTTKGVGEGSGMGLSTVYGIVKQSGGYVDIDSTPGEGTAVRVWIPIAETDMDAERDGSAFPANGAAARAVTVLVAEDSAAVRAVIRRSLQSAGFRVLEAADGLDALGFFTRQGAEIDLLITDISMPRLGGSKLVVSIRELGHRPAVIVMTGNASAGARAYPELGETALFLDKPFANAELLALAQRALAARSGQDDNNA